MRGQKMKKQLALGLAALLAVSSLTACNNESPTESELREQIAQLESELNKTQGNSDNTENNSKIIKNISSWYWMVEFLGVQI